MLDLQDTVEVEATTQCVGIIGLIILPSSTTWNVICEHATLLPREIQRLPWRNPIAGPGLKSYTFPTNRVAHQVAVVGITARIIEIPKVKITVSLEGSTAG